MILYLPPPPNPLPSDYMHTPLVACRIASTFPDAKLIALLRDPVERALSHWNMLRVLFEKDKTRDFDMEVRRGAGGREGRRGGEGGDCPHRPPPLPSPLLTLPAVAPPQQQVELQEIIHPGSDLMTARTDSPPPFSPHFRCSSSGGA